MERARVRRASKGGLGARAPKWAAASLARRAIILSNDGPLLYECVGCSLSLAILFLWLWPWLARLFGTSRGPTHSHTRTLPL